MLAKAGVAHVLVVAGDREVDFLDLAVRNDYRIWGKLLPQAFKSMDGSASDSKIEKLVIAVVTDELPRLVREHSYRGVVKSADIVKFIDSDFLEIKELFDSQH